MRLASYVPGELILCAFVWLDPGITPCCKTRMFFAVEGLSVSFCHNPLFRSGIEPLRHRHLTHDLRRTSVWRQWRWTAKELGEAAQVLRGGGEQYLVPGAA
jgi:hypothetical protein